jgi:hydrogenase maturation protein HypF
VFLIPTAEIRITGIVQGVGFRPFLYNLLDKYGCTGTIQNTGNLGVILHLANTDPTFDFQDLAANIRKNAPEIAMIENIEIFQRSDEIPPNKIFDRLTIIPSGKETGEGLALPPDIAMCDKCLLDFNNPQNSRYYHYPFIACAQCGPRFTTMRSLPYDRIRSTMDAFPLCEGPDSCDKEYNDSNDRRFHAQTFGCRRCGPNYYQYKINQNQPDSKLDPETSLDNVIDALKRGQTAALQGIGGIFLVCLAEDAAAIENLRNRKRGRRFKPFAVMMSSIEIARKYVHITAAQEAALTSFRRPIVLCEKRENTLPENIAPGLAHIGIILPYTGIHYLLFEQLENRPLIYTSGNVSGIPMALSQTDILSQLRKMADVFYLHNRIIYQRCDDSVLRFVGEIPTLIRRSRGYVPEYIRLPFTSPFKAMIGMGAELSTTGAVARGDRIFPTQHIGHVTNLETERFLADALSHMQSLLQIKQNEIGLIVRDLHPLFYSSKLGEQLYNDLVNSPQGPSVFPIQLLSVQHHHAHMAALMVDARIPFENDIIAIGVDGVGYGSDGQVWGGEILAGTYNKADRVGSLQPVPMVGGDLCAKWPLRMLLCQLATGSTLTEFPELLQHHLDVSELASWFPRGTPEVQYLIQQLQKKPSLDLSRVPMSTSLGRWLDSASALLNICSERTYRGEPAMRLEGTAFGGQSLHLFDLDAFISGTIIRGDKLLVAYAQHLLHHPNLLKSPATVRDLAYSMQSDIARLLARCAIAEGTTRGYNTIGITGGVAYNECIVTTVKKEVEAAGFRWIQHERIPPGDGGLSIGQLAIGAAQNMKK